MPDYFCNDPIPVLEIDFIEILFYEVDKNFQPKWSNLQQLAEVKIPDLILGVNYFGQPLISNDLKNFCIKYNSWLIEDATHCLKRDKKIGNQGDFILFSPYKHLPIPDGAILFVKGNGPSKLNLDFFKKISIKRTLKSEVAKLKSKISVTKKNYLFVFQWFVKQLIFSVFKNSSILKNYFKKKYIEALNQNYPNTIYSFEISKVSVFLLKRFDLDLIAKNKLRNQILFTKFLDKSNRFHSKYLFNENYDFHAPYMLPIYLKSKKEAIDLISQGIPVIKWPLLPKDQRNSKNVIENFNEFYFILLNYPLNKKNLLKNLKTRVRFNKVRFLKKNIPEYKFQDDENINFIQSKGFGISKANVEKKQLELYDVILNGNRVGSFHILIKKYFIFLSILRLNRGPILKSNLDLEDKFLINSKLMDLGNILKGRIFSFSPELSFYSLDSILLKNNRNFRLPLPNWKSIKINLLNEEESILKNLKPKWRNALRFAQKSNISVKKSKNPATINKLLEKYVNYSQIKNFKGVNPQILRKMTELNNKEESLFVLDAIKAEEIIASILISKYGYNILYLIGWSNDKGRDFNANYLLIWEAIVKFKKYGCKSFDLGGLIGGNHPIDFFKLGLNGTYYENSGEYLSF